MAISIREIGHKAENLIEQGKEAEQEVQNCQSGVTNAQQRVAAAQRAVMAASQVDENGNPRGDVQMAQAQLHMAQNILAASQRSLAQAQARLREVSQAKMEQVSEIQEYKEVEKRNLARANILKSMAFSADSAALAGIADRMNEAESARVALLESLGMDAAAEYFDYDFGGGSDGNWSRQYSSLSTSGQLVHQHGGGGKSLGGGSGGGGSYGGSDGGYGGAGLGGVGSAGYGTGGYGDATGTGGYGDAAGAGGYGGANGYGDGAAGGTGGPEGYGVGGAYGGATEYDLIDAIMASPNMTLAEKKEALLAFRMGVLNAAAQGMAGNQEGAQEWPVMSPEEKRARGELYVDRMMDIYRENLIEHGAMEGEVLDAAMEVMREHYQGELEKELGGQASGLYVDPNYGDIVQGINVRQCSIPAVVQGRNMMDSFRHDPMQGTRAGQQAAQVQGYLGHPHVVSSGAFQEKVDASGVILYRTFNPGEDTKTGASRTSREFADQLIYAKQGQLNGSGEMVYGEGIYFTINRGHSPGTPPDGDSRKGAWKDSSRYGDEATRTVVAATVQTDMKIGNYLTVANEYASFCRNERNDCRRFGGWDEAGVAAYAISQGYDALLVEGADFNSDYFVVYNRTKLIFPEGGNE